MKTRIEAVTVDGALRLAVGGNVVPPILVETVAMLTKNAPTDDRRAHCSQLVWATVPNLSLKEAKDLVEAVTDLVRVSTRPYEMPSDAEDLMRHQIALR